MEVFFILPLLVSSASAADLTCCSQVNAIERVASSASGRWYLMAVKSREFKDEKNSHTKQGECNRFASDPPPSCSVYDFQSLMPEPYITQYEVITHPYNKMSGKYNVQHLNMELAANASNMAIFEIMSTDNGCMDYNKMVVRGLATDDHQSFMLLHICKGEEPNAEVDMWYLTRSPIMTDYRLEQLSQALAQVGMTADDMTSVSHDDCVYPPSQAERKMNDKFRVF